MSETYSVGGLIDAVHERFAAADLFYGHGTDNAWDEAVALVLHATGVADDREELDKAVPSALLQDVFDIAQRRMEHRVPLPYLLGEATYMGLTFGIRPGVVIPRSPIGYLLGERLVPWLPGRIDRVLDIGCGSGCLGILAGRVFEDAELVLADVDPVACALAGQNLARHGLADRAQVVSLDITAPDAAERLLAAVAGEPFDLVLANPPYVDEADMATLPQEYRAEPPRGLAAGVDGLSVMRHILSLVPVLLAPTGLFVGEVGASQPALLRTFPQAPFVWPELDLGGEGVFLLEGRSLSSHTAPLRSSV